MAAQRLRVTVFVRWPDSEPEYEGAPQQEWVHEEDYRTDDRGVVLTWDGSSRVFIPWSSVLRVDWDPCRCVDCR